MGGSINRFNSRGPGIQTIYRRPARDCNSYGCWVSHQPAGYLIINQIAEDIENKRFSILDFATRRTFRILPAFLLVMGVCLALSTTIFMQAEPKDFAESELVPLTG
jgi:hypothetical protein